MKIKASIKNKIFAAVVFFSLTTIIATSAVYYYSLTKDIHDMSHEHIKLAFEMIFGDLRSDAAGSVLKVEKFISDFIAGNMRIIYVVQDRPDLEEKTELERWRQIQELMSRYNRITTAIDGFTPLLGINGLAIYGKDRKILALYQNIAKQKVLGACPNFVEDGSFISFLTKEERLQSLKGVDDLPRRSIPNETMQIFQGEIPDSTIATLSTYGNIVAIKIVAPIKHYDRLLGVSVIYIGIPQSDVERYSRFSQTEINLFVGTILSCGIFNEYKSISYDASEIPPSINLLNLQDNFSLDYLDITVDDKNYHQGRILVAENNEIIGAITASFPLQIEKEKKEELFLYVFGVGILFSFLSFFVSALLSSRIVRPIKELEGATKKFQEKDFTVSVPVYSDDEIGTLANAFNEMVQQIQESFCKINTEITERKKAEEELRKAKEKAEHINEAKSEFLMNVSHDIRTPMNVINGFNDLLMKTNLNEEQEKFCKMIKRKGKDLISLIEDIIDISAVEKGKVRMHYSPFFVGDLLKDIHETLEVQMGDKKIEFQCDVGEGVPKKFMGDLMRLKQVLENLCGNAVKYTEKGNINLTISAEGGPDESQDRVIRFVVEDTGIGISEENLPHIFEPYIRFYELKNGGYQEGVGMGLHIVKTLLREMGSEIAVESEVGKGSKFSFGLKMKETGASVIEEENMLPENPDEEVEFAGMNILIAEDDDATQELMKVSFKKSKCNIRIVCNGEEVLEEMKKRKYDLVLMDLRMPRMDGFEATEEIRKNIDKDVVILALTAHVIDWVEEDCKTAGMNGYITKPIDIDKLKRAIQEYAK